MVFCSCDIRGHRPKILFKVNGFLFSWFGAVHSTIQEFPRVLGPGFSFMIAREMMHRKATSKRLMITVPIGPPNCSSQCYVDGAYAFFFSRKLFAMLKWEHMLALELPHQVHTKIKNAECPKCKSWRNKRATAAFFKLGTEAKGPWLATCSNWCVVSTHANCTIKLFIILAILI